MTQEAMPHGPDVRRLMVPEDLHRQLHDANLRLRAASARLEEAMDETALIYRHGQQVEMRLGDVRKAEGDLEEISGEIQKILGQCV